LSVQVWPSQKDISPLTVKRVVRRTKLKDTATRDQVYYKVSAFATAEEYNLEALALDVQNCGYYVVKMPEDAFDALHVEAQISTNDEPKRIFFFREGSIVFWNVPDSEQSDWLVRVRSHQEGSYDDHMTREEQETLEFTYTNNQSRLANGEIELWRPVNESDKSVHQLDMFAFSNALSLSVKLAVWEALLAQYVDSIEWVLQDLKDGKKIRMSEGDVLRKAGELFTLSHLINLSSDLLDTPDFYWDRDELEKLYNKTCNYLNIARRTRVMNEKLGQCVELTELLRDHLKDKHHTRLELMIILLITIEVCFAVFHLFERHYLYKDEKKLTDD
jgi:glutathione synthase